MIGVGTTAMGERRKRVRFYSEYRASGNLKCKSWGSVREQKLLRGIIGVREDSG
jgi:hypothetical protein